MRRIRVLGMRTGFSSLLVPARAPKLHERLMAGCEAMFERMPDTFPPKRAMRSLEEIRVDTGRILELLEARNCEAIGRGCSDASPIKAVSHAT